MIRQYVDCALRKARYDKLEDGTFVAEIPELDGVLANAESLEECRDQLVEVVEEWILIRISRNLEVPVLDGITVSVSSRS